MARDSEFWLKASCQGLYRDFDSSTPGVGLGRGTLVERALLFCIINLK